MVDSQMVDELSNEQKRDPKALLQANVMQLLNNSGVPSRGGSTGSSSTEEVKMVSSPSNSNI